MRVLIDADGCPVVDIAITCARRRNVSVILVCDTAHEFQRDGAETIVVSQGADSADFRLVNLLERGDLVITQDYGLAAMCLAKCAIPISQDGMVYDSNNIESLLNARYIAKKIRMAGGRLKGSAKRTSAQDERFAKALHALLLIKA